MKKQWATRLAAFGMTALAIYIFILGIPERKPEPAVPEMTEPPVLMTPLPTAEGGTLPSFPDVRLTPQPNDDPKDGIRETSIVGGLSIRNETEYTVDVSALIQAGTDIRLPKESAQILIIHTHASEAYAPAGLDRYEASDENRTEDPRYNVIRIGDELAELYAGSGLSVIHDRGIYDYPSYTGSYTRCGEMIEWYLREYPSIRVVIDLHRDALGSGDVVYKTVAEEDGSCASQVMLLVGSDAGGLEHPNWRSNLSLALYLQNAVDRMYPSLMRPVELVAQRYNQQLSPGSLILEVGSSGNTLQEALAAIRLFGKATAPALLALSDAE